MKPNPSAKKPAPARSATRKPAAAWVPISVAFPSPQVLASSQRIPVQRSFDERPEPPRPQLFLHKPAAR